MVDNMRAGQYGRACGGHSRWIRPLGISLTAVALSALAVGGATAAAGSACAAVPPGASLSGVTAVSRSDAWAVGAAGTQTLVIHWNGASWCDASAPIPGSLSAVKATSSSNAWAVGKDRAGKTLIVHWNGTSWQRQPSPNPGQPALSDALYAIAATSSSNAWAVGNSESVTGHFRALILHWNGTAWKAIPSPAPSSSFPDLLGGTATSASDAWAAAIYTTGVVPHTLLLHWNGSAWKIVNSGVSGGFLDGMAAGSRSRVWAVGDNADSVGGFDTLVIRWNGHTWLHVRTPVRQVWFVRLTGVTATSRSKAWAVGYYALGAGQPARTLILHWNGARWQRQPSPDPGGRSSSDALFAVAATSRSDAWAVGKEGSGVLILHWNGTAWKLSR